MDIVVNSDFFYNPLLQAKLNPEVSFLHLNYLGTPVIATNKDGAITQSIHLIGEFLSVLRYVL